MEKTSSAFDEMHEAAQQGVSPFPYVGGSLSFGGSFPRLWTKTSQLISGLHGTSPAQQSMIPY